MLYHMRDSFMRGMFVHTLALMDAYKLPNFLIWVNCGGLRKSIDYLKSIYPTTFKKFIKKYKLTLDNTNERKNHYIDTRGLLAHKGEVMNIWTNENMKESYTIEGILLEERP